MVAGDSYPSQDHLPGTREMLHVHEGTLTLSSTAPTTRSAAGAAVLFDADRPHGYANRGPQGAALHDGRVGSVGPVRPARRRGARGLTPGDDGVRRRR